MRHEVFVQLDARQQFELLVDSQDLPDPVAAKAWLDSEFTRMECEPLRASGKLLMADRLLVMAQEAGPRGLADPSWGPAFARAVVAVLQRPRVTINLDTMSVGS